MANKFLIIINEKDKERFQIFKSKSIKRNELRIWGMSNIQKSAWNALSKNNLIFFAIQNSDDVIKGKLDKKEFDKELSSKLWKDTPRNKMINYFLYFKKIEGESTSFYQMLKHAGLHRASHIFPGLYELKSELQDQAGLPRTRENKMQIPVDLDEAPETKTSSITRFIRDTKKTKLLKKKYRNKCQICNYRIVVGKNEFYSEVHHLRPLKDGGDDNYNNMLVLCPTHHAEFDYKVIGIDRDGHTIINRNGKTNNQLTIMKDHKIRKDNILFHLDGIDSK